MDKCLELLILIMLGFRRNYRSTKFFCGAHDERLAI